MGALFFVAGGRAQAQYSFGGATLLEKESEPNGRK
jgi:hypothetical protein